MSLYREMEVGEDARRVLESEAFKEAWEAYSARVMEELVAAPSNNVELILHLKRVLAVVNGVRGHLERLVAEGKVAMNTIQLEEKRKRFKVF